LNITRFKSVHHSTNFTESCKEVLHLDCYKNCHPHLIGCHMVYSPPFGVVVCLLNAMCVQLFAGTGKRHNASKYHQLVPYDPIWQVTLRGSEMGYHWQTKTTSKQNRPTLDKIMFLVFNGEHKRQIFRAATAETAKCFWPWVWPT